MDIFVQYTDENTSELFWQIKRQWLASLSDSSLRLLISLKNTDIWQYMLEERKVNRSGKKKNLTNISLKY